jgi:hypothetical protein
VRGVVSVVLQSNARRPPPRNERRNEQTNLKAQTTLLPQLQQHRIVIATTRATPSSTAADRCEHTSAGIFRAAAVHRIVAARPDELCCSLDNTPGGGGFLIIIERADIATTDTIDAGFK